MCMYDKKGEAGCFECELADCMRDDITKDIFLHRIIGTESTKTTEEREEHKAEIKRRKKELGVRYLRSGRETEYMREYRANMSEEQKDRYRAWQREYIRKKRAEARQAV